MFWKVRAIPNLEGFVACEARTVKCHLTTGGGVDAGDRVKESGFACAVRSDHAGDHAFFDGEIHLVDGGQAAECHSDIFCFKECHGDILALHLFVGM